jgi:hypothetical protein
MRDQDQSLTLKGSQPISRESHVNRLSISDQPIQDISHYKYLPNLTENQSSISSIEQDLSKHQRTPWNRFSGLITFINTANMAAAETATFMWGKEVSRSLIH